MAARPGGVRRGVRHHAPTSRRASGTACPTAGTSAHSFTLLHDTEADAFRAQVTSLGKGTTLLVDTYDIAEAVALGVEVAGPGARRGPASTPATSACSPARCAPSSTTSARPATRIIVTSDLDEFAIAALAARRSTPTASAPSWSPARGHPTCGFVYKLVAREDDDGEMVVGGEEEHRQDLDRRPQVRPAPALPRDGVAEAEVVGIGEPAGRRRRRPRRCSCRWSATARSSAARPLDDARARHHASRAELPLAAQQMSRGEPVIPTHPPVRLPVAPLTCDFFSDDPRGRHLDVRGAPPADREPDRGRRRRVRDGPPPVLYLLHGLTDDHTAWQRYTSIGRYAEAAGLAVVMPAVHHSFYADEVARPPLLDVRLRGAARRSSSRSSGSPTGRPTPSSPGSRWAGTARSSSRSPIPSGTPPPRRCRAPSTSAT